MKMDSQTYLNNIGDSLPTFSWYSQPSFHGAGCSQISHQVLLAQHGHGDCCMEKNHGIPSPHDDLGDLGVNRQVPERIHGHQHLGHLVVTPFPSHPSFILNTPMLNGPKYIQNNCKIPFERLLKHGFWVLLKNHREVGLPISHFTRVTKVTLWSILGTWGHGKGVNVSSFVSGAHGVQNCCIVNHHKP